MGPGGKKMAVSLSKGGNVSLSKEAPGLKKVLVGLGWDARATDGAAFDLDASAFILADSGKVRSDSDFIFYNNVKSTDGTIEHTGDNRTGVGDGDDEAIKVNLAALPAEVSKIAFTVTIDKGDVNRQNFGMVSSAYIRVVNDENGTEIARYDLSEDASTETAMVFGEVYRHGSEWKFRAVGQGYAGGLKSLAQNYGIHL
jgi:tellurium resistance protein TerD